MIRTLRNWMASPNKMAPSSSRRLGRRVLLNLQDLESRDVPAQFFVQITSLPAGETGSSGATHTGALYLNPGVGSIDNDRLIIDAVDREEAVRRGLSGGVTVRFGAVAAHHRYQMTPSITVGYDTANASANNRPYAVQLVPEAEGGDGETKYRVLLEDLAGIPGTVSDGDYNDRYWDIRVTTQGDQAIGPSLVFQNADGSGLSYLKVGKWENAFDPTQGGGAPTLKNNFIELDPDRFTIVVVDNRYSQGGQLDGQGKPVQESTYNPTNDPMIVDKVSVYVRTTVDAGAWITLTEEGGAGSGVFRSMTLLAVSNDVDDNHAVDGVADDGIDDRTFKVALGYTHTSINMTADYEVNPGSHLIKTIIAPIEKVVKLHINILKLANGTAVITPAFVESYVSRANEIYAQVGIVFLLAGQINEVNQPAGVDLSNNFSRFQGVDLNGKLNMTNEEKALLGFADYRTLPVNGNSDDIEVYYVNLMAPRALGLTYSIVAVPDDKYADSVVIEADTTYRTLAHEIGHVLTGDGGHPDGTVGVNLTNLMASPSQVTGLVSDSRRITTAQAALMFSHRLNLLHVP